MSTSPIVSFGLYALEVKRDSAPSASDLQPYAKIADLATDSAATLPYADYEPDFWLLDGGYKFMPANPARVHVGLVSQSMSDGAGDFAIPPVLTVDFSAVHTSDGLTLKFSPYTGDYASQISVAYYDASLALIRQDLYAPTGWEFTVSQTVTDFKRLVITFYSTNRPMRYLRLSGIDYGSLIYFQGSDVKEASLTEDIDPLGGDARFNTLTLRLHSDDGAFSIINPSGYYQYLQQRQPIAVHEQMNGQLVFMGQFYLQKWENRTDTEIEFQCIDLLGVLDTIIYKGGLWTGIAVETLLQQILEPIYIPYTLDSALYGAQVAGWIPICTFRQALQQIAFSIGAYVDCSRSGAIKVIPVKIAANESTPVTELTNADKSTDQSLSLKPIVTGVEVTAHNYLSVTTTQQLYSGTLQAGLHEITFNAPMHNLSVTGATITDSGVNYALLNVAATGTVTLSGQIYIDTTRVASVYTAGLSTSIMPNVLKVTDATLVNPANVQAITQRIYDYYQQRLLQRVKLYAPSIAPGDIVLVDTLYGQKLMTQVEKMVTDLAGGMRSQVDLTGATHA